MNISESTFSSSESFNKPSESNNENKKRSFIFIPFHSEINNFQYSGEFLFSLLDQLHRPFFLICLNQNKIFYPASFEETFNIPSENIEKELQKFWETENLSFIIDNLFQNFAKEKNVRIDKTVKIFKEKTPYNLSISILSIAEKIACAIFEAKEGNKKETGQKEKLEAIINQHNTFLKNLSHEIRTPLNSIIGFTELINLTNLSNAQKVNYLDIIKNRSRALLNFIDELVELSKLENQSVDINLSETDLPLLFNEIHSEYLQEIQQRGSTIDLFLKIPPKSALSVCYIDKGQLYQIVQYFLETSLSYTENGYIQFGYEIKEPKYLNFYIKDTGKGFTREQQKILFNRLASNEDVIDSEIQNIGLKLNIARLMIENMGGKLTVNSTSGQGTLFSFTLPYYPHEKIANPEVQPHEKRRPNWKNKVILIAEDDEINFQFLEAILSDTNAQLIHVFNGKQAVDISKSLPKIDLILMDIKMPEKSGYQAIKEIKQIRNIPIIAQTAYSAKEDKDKCLNAGCNDYITKPIDIELFFEILNKYLND
jgi:signal transduction histidine kinase/CheY-like chemotaxis protein